MPTRVCLKIIGPGEEALTAMDVMRMMGRKMIRQMSDPKTSIILLKKSARWRWLAGIFSSMNLELLIFETCAGF